MLYGIILGILVAILKGVDTIFNKSLSKDKTIELHSFYCILFTIPFLLCMSLCNWKLDIVSTPFLFMYSFFEMLNIYYHQKAIKILNPVHTEILSKSKIWFVYILSIFFLIESVSVSGFVTVILFVASVIIGIDFKNFNYKEFSDIKGYIYEIISVVSRTIKPFILRTLLISGTISNEVLIFFSMIIASFWLFIVFKPKIVFDKTKFSKYLFRAGLDSVSMILSGYAIFFAGALVTSMTECFSIFVVAILSRFIFKQKIEFKMWLSITLAIISISLFNLLG